MEWTWCHSDSGGLHHFPGKGPGLPVNPDVPEADQRRVQEKALAPGVGLPGEREAKEKKSKGRSSIKNLEVILKALPARD